MSVPHIRKDMKGKRLFGMLMHNDYGRSRLILSKVMITLDFKGFYTPPLPFFFFFMLIDGWA